MLRHATLVAGGALVLLAAVVGVIGKAPSTNIRPSSPHDAQKDAVWNQFRVRQEQLPQLSENVTFIAVGDVMLAREVGNRIARHGVDYPFAATNGYLHSADFVFANLETSITEGRSAGDPEMSFRADPGVENGLKNANVQVVSLANNHTPNYGGKGLNDTVRLLDAADIRHAGAGENAAAAHESALLTVRGVRIAFLAYNDTDVVPDSYGAAPNRPGTAFMDIPTMQQDVHDAQKEADVVIVSMHSGAEYTPAPNTAQTSFAHAAIDAGAALVLGHHPHVVQTVEQYNGKYILYSLGNFVFDQMWSRATREGMTAFIRVGKEGVRSLTFSPVRIDDYSQPQLMNAQESEHVLERLGLPLERGARFFWDAAAKTFAVGNVPLLNAEAPAAPAQTVGQRTGDLDNDGTDESYVLADGSVTVTEGGATLWRSEPSWWVSGAALADANNDGTNDLILSIWKAGNYGTSRPRWEATNDQSIKNHLFVFDLQKNAVTPLWQSSNLEAPNCAFTFGDVTNDGKQDLVVIEGEYTEPGRCSGKYVAVWSWSQWGFANEWRSEPGKYQTVRVERSSGAPVIIAE